jgi:hypothetical protein
MANLWEQLMTLAVEKATNASDLGEILNLEIVNWKQLMMNKWDAQMEAGLGGSLPPEANPYTNYTGSACVKVTPARTQVYDGQSLDLTVLIMENPTSATLYYRPLGGGSYSSLSLTNVARGVYEVTIPAQSDDFEYYIDAQTPIGNATYPVTAPSINQTVVVLTAGGAPDTDPPSPDPMTWATVPNATGENSIAMTATTASDPSGVEYYFDETTGEPGGTDSGWQASTSYTDTGLSASTQYCYEVTARDQSVNLNETAASTNQCATTDAPDTTPPTPDPMTWASVPAADDHESISMTATTATDPSGVEYYFDETTGGGNDSAWQSSTSYTDTGLSASTQYCYQVRARDLSVNQNATAWSTNECATTDTAPQWTVIISDDFEAGWGNWNDGGSDARRYTGGTYAHQGTACMAIQDNTSTSVVTTSNLAMSSYDEVKVDFWYRGQSMETNEDFWLQISTNGGGNFTTVQSWARGTDFNNGTFYPDSVIITGYTLTDQTQIRFRCDASGNGDDVYIDEVVVSGGGGTPDTDPPTPNPATFASAPSADSDTAISMTATTGSDASGPVEYYFDETSGNSGGSDSGWQTSTSYTDTGLSASTQYTYTVQMRDFLNNTGTASAPANATTDPTPDTDPPTPNPAAFASPPAAISDTEISMTATTGTDASSPVEYFFDETSGNPGGTDSGWQTSTSYTDTGLTGSTQYTYTVQMRDSLNNTGTASAPVNATTDPTPDTDPPTPNPATWASVPAAGGTDNISMTATTGTDASGPVEYFFDETSGNPGGTDSGWQTSASYTDTGLSPSTQYTYTVQMRDSVPNTGTASNPANATTQATPDTTPPTPNPATFASPPAAISDTAISMTATTGSDQSGPVQYYFDETSGNPGGSDSGWQTSASYTDTGLTGSTQYTYTVQMRDSVPNTGTASSPANATTQATPDTTPPTPNPATFASPPAAISDTAISMTATTGSDPSGPNRLWLADEHKLYRYRPDRQYTIYVHYTNA